MVFAVVQSLMAPVATKLARQHASALLGVVGLASTFVALLVTTLLPGGLSIRGLATWVLATLFVWLITALGTWLLPMLFLRDRERLNDRTGKRQS